MSDDSLAPDAQTQGARAFAGDVSGRRALRPRSKLCASITLVWISFAIYLHGGLAEALEHRFGALLREATGWSLSLVPAASDANLAHLLFAVILATLQFPLSTNRGRAKVQPLDWLTVLAALALAGYLIWYRSGFAEGQGLPPRVDWAVGAAAVLVLCMTVRRTIGVALFVVTVISVLLALFGSDFASAFLRAPETTARLHPLQVFWSGTEGVFGRLFDAAVTLLFPLVLFGVVWLQSGAGVYISKLTASVMGARAGGAAKASVAASLVSACYAPSARSAVELSLSADRDLMERTGFCRTTAQTIVRACSIHGQIAPPIMAGAIVLIADQTGLSVGRVVLHAIVPTAIAYIALYLFVHFDAERSQTSGLPTQPVVPNQVRNAAGLLGWMLLTGALVAGAAIVQTWIRRHAPGAVVPVSIAAWLALYLGLLWSASRRPDLRRDEPDAPIAELAPFGATLAGGLYLFMPLFFLILQIIGTNGAAASSVLVCAALAAGIGLTHHPIKALFRGQFAYLPTATWRGMRDLFTAALQAGQVMATVVIAAGAAGLVLSSLSLSGLDSLLAEALHELATYHSSLALLLVAASALIVTTGMPTSIGYLVLSVLVVPGVLAGTEPAPAIAVHLFVLYVCVLASAPIPRLVAAPLLLVPLAFYANPELLLVGVAPLRVPVVAATAVLGAVAMAAALHRFLLVPNRVWETVALALSAVGLLHPALFLNGPMRDLVYLPALALMAGVWLIQLRRQP